VKVNGAPPDPVQPQPWDVNRVNIFVGSLWANKIKEEHKKMARLKKFFFMIKGFFKGYLVL
jgi:hypothetical protein